MSISQGSIISFFLSLLSGAVRRCEIVGGASRFFVAVHHTIATIAIYMAARIPMI